MRVVVAIVLLSIAAFVLQSAFLATAVFWKFGFGATEPAASMATVLVQVLLATGLSVVAAKVWWRWRLVLASLLAVMGAVVIYRGVPVATDDAHGDFGTPLVVGGIASLVLGLALLGWQLLRGRAGRTARAGAIVLFAVWSSTHVTAEQARTGLNVPWWRYGDVGANAWGHDGVSSGRFSRSVVPDSSGFTRVRLVQGTSCSGTGALKIATDLNRDRRSGEITLDLASHLPGFCPTSAALRTLDLSRARMRVKLKLPTGAAGSAVAPNGLQFVWKSKVHDRWPAVYSNWINLPSSTDGACVEFVVPVTTVGAAVAEDGANLAAVSLVGLKMGLGGDASRPLSSDIYIDDFTIESNPEFVLDFERSDVEREFERIRELSRGEMSVARVWLCADGRACPEFGPDGTVTGYDDDFFDDVDTLLNASRRTGVRLILVMLDFTAAEQARVVAGVRIGGRADLFRDRRVRQSFFDNALRPFLDRYAGRPEIAAIEPVNEFEWVIEEVPERIPVGVDVVPLKDAREFVRQFADLVHQRSPGYAVTLGVARRAWTRLWTGLGVDSYGVHWYDNGGEEFPFQPCPEDLDAPCFIGEVPTANTAHSANALLAAAEAAGYRPPLLFWSCRAADEYSDFPAALAALFGARAALEVRRR